MPKAKDSDNKDVSDYLHARNVVDAKMKIDKNRSYEIFQYRNPGRRDKTILKTNLENLELNERTQKGLGIESSTQFGSSREG